MLLLRVDLAELKIKKENIPSEYRLFSGRALTSRIISDEVSGTCHPLGPFNKLVIANGLLAGTPVSSASRISIGAKSPLTSGIKESNGGGNTAYKMARLGIRAIILEGETKTKSNWYILYINKEGAKLIDGSYLENKGTYDKTDALHEQYGKNIGIILIGPAGEQLSITAGITNTDIEGNPSRYCGRGGLGAVMGSKRILAIVLDDAGTSPVKPVETDNFKYLLKKYTALIRSTPQTAEGFPKYGTAGMMEITNTIGALPTRNFSTGTFEGAAKINGQALYDTITERGGEGASTHACMPGCIIRCSNRYPDKDGKILVSPLEYETIAMLGSNCDIDDLDVIAKLNYICNDYGIDTIEFGCTIGVLMEKGIMAFGDTKEIVKVAEEMQKGSYLGKIIGAGSIIAGQVFGVTRVPAVKGQGMPAYDPRSVKGLGVTYSTSPMGADHTAGNTVRLNIKHHLKDNQVEISKNAQLGATLFDSLGICIMVGAAVKDKNLLAGLISSHTGLACSEDILIEIALSTLTTEKKFNNSAGITSVHDRLPEFFYTEVNPSNGVAFDIFDQDL
ncbi:MAG: aldehyde:ferredoxin oxidoreductase [Clostridiaceae bacterium BRH_c20a]|nr:MAG: aldehyde:ferredoxin oxidoreductase [Clostridiaceae bacterium BRH_c20a]